jgi:hypothetical protein
MALLPDKKKRGRLFRFPPSKSSENNYSSFLHKYELGVTQAETVHIKRTEDNGKDFRTHFLEKLLILRKGKKT